MHSQAFHQLVFCARWCQTAFAALASQSLDAEWSVAVFLGEVDWTRRRVDAGNVKAPLGWNRARRLLQIAKDCEG
jgi:hypothetical protein